jgi:hypothetical protein
VVVVCAWATPAAAQLLPVDSLVLGNGRVAVGGDISMTASCSHAEGGAACADDTGFFNYSDYENSTLRMLRAGLSTSIRINRQLSALAEIRFENTDHPRPYGVYLRYTPFEGRNFDVQAGRIPSTFGAFARRTYSTDNPLIGYPLAYQYLISLRPDALPATTDDLLRMRGRGWLSSFPIGNQTPESGVPLVDTFRWDTGVQLHGGTDWIEAAASVTTGSLSNPLFRDDNSGRNVAARVQLQPLAGLIVGASGSRAPYVTSHAASLANAPVSGFVQEAAGADVEYSRDYYLVRFEMVVSTYDLATIQPRLQARSAMLEGRYKLTPRIHLAGRIDHLGFSSIAGRGGSTTWDAPVTRWEVGGGYALQRNAQIRLSLQHNSRDGGRVRRMTALSTQLLYWF